MGLWEVLFRSNGGSDRDTVKVRRSGDRITADKLTHHGGSAHTHRSYNLNTRSGAYKEYSGGPRSSDRGGGGKRK